MVKDLHIDPSSLDRTSGTPLANQIATALETRILNGNLPNGHKLPSTRRLSETLGVARNTVTEAFDILTADGWIQAISGSGTFVTGAPTLSAPPQPDIPPRELPAPSCGIINSFAWGPTLDYFPFDIWNDIGAGLGCHMREMTVEGDAQGYLPLREQICRHLNLRRHLDCRPDQVIVTSGMTQGLDLVTRSFLKAGRTALIEDPCELRVRTTMALSGAQVIGLPVDDEGIEIARAPERFDMVHLSPVHQFPTGAVLSPEREARLRMECDRNDALIVEMDNTALIDPPRDPILRPQDRRTIYLGTVSWTLFRSLRIGYMVLPETLIAHVLGTRMAMDHRPPLFEQYMLEAFMRQGHFERYIDRMRGILAPRRHALTDCWPGSPMPGVRLSPQPGGLGHMLRLPDGTDMNRLLRRAAARGMEPRDISGWFDNPDRRALLLGFALAGRMATMKGVRDLAALLSA